MDEEFDVDSTSIVEIDGSDTSPTFFDGMEDPVLDKNCPEIDQIGCFIDYYVKCSTCSANKQTLLDKNNKQIFVMLSCFAFDSVSSTKSTTNPPEIWLLAVAAFQKAIDTIFMSEEYNTLFLSKFPTKTWPTAFTTYLENLQDLDNPSEKWIQCNAKGYRQADPAIIRKLYYGYKIIAIAKKASKDIKLHYNRCFIF